MNPQIEKNRKPLVYALLVSASIAVVFSITIFISYEYYQNQKIQQLHSELNRVTENVRKILTNSNLAAFSVGLTIDPAEDSINHFTYVAKEIMNRHPYLFGVQILRKGKIAKVYPYDDHQSVIGYDILEDPNTRIEAEKAIEKKEIYYAGPLEFQQGGIGIIGRLPIFHEKEFWGFSAVLIKMDDFLKVSGIADTTIEHIGFQLSKINPNTQREEFFTLDRFDSNLSLNYSFEESGWKITAIHRQDPVIFLFMTFIILLSVAFSFGSGLYTYQVLKRPEELEALLSEKTKEIKENNEYLTSLVQAIPDLIFIYDKDARYLDFHAYQDSLLFYKPEEFIGKSIYELFENEFAQQSHEAIKQAIKSKEITEKSYHLDFKEGKKYFEARYIAINSEKVLSVVREVSAKVLVAQKLEKSEQKYRNLVSQAADAIFVADENGKLLELNEKGYQLTGMPSETVQNYNLNKIVELLNKDGLLLTELIHQQGTALEEANLIAFDGKRIDVEISCKISASREIQGIIRDITSRNNFIRAIQKQNERLKEIAWIQSHQVRAPLARLLGLLDFIEKYHAGSQEEQIKVTNSIRSSALELDIIIRDVVRRTEEAEDSIS